MTEHAFFGGVIGVIKAEKTTDGKYRWVLVSSNAYKDRDNEIVSLQALQDDVARTDVTHECGPLRWWHTPGLDIGTCDFRALHGRFLIESGTFINEKIAHVIAKEAPNLQVSLGFYHPITEPTEDGVYHHIRSFERSLVPAGRAANPYTQFIVLEGQDMPMQKEKEEALRSMIGDDDLLNALLTEVAQSEEALIQQGVATKCMTKKMADGSTQRIRVIAMPVEEEEDEEEEIVIQKGKKTMKAKATPKKAAPKEEMLTEDMPETGGSEPEFAMDLTIEEFRNLLDDHLGGVVEQIQSLLSTPKTTKKDDEVAQLREEMLAIRHQNEQLIATIKELQGDTPRGFQASTARETVTEKASQVQTTSFQDLVMEQLGLR